jgi:hypothetical protein
VRQNEWFFDESERRAATERKLARLTPPERFVAPHAEMLAQLTSQHEPPPGSGDSTARVEARLASAAEAGRWVKWIANAAESPEESEYSRAVNELADRSRAEFDRAVEHTGTAGERTLERLRGTRPPEGGAAALDACKVAFEAYLGAQQEFCTFVQVDPPGALEAWKGLERRRDELDEALAQASA